MQYDKKMITYPACAFIACAMAFVLATAMMPTADSSAQDVDQDLGQFYSYTVQFIFNGSQAESISWDFGDSSAISTEWNPRHEFPAIGTYYVTQTVTNSYNGGSTTTSVYKVEIMGFPVITFSSNGGSAVESIHQTAYNATATQPADPVLDGYVFLGWYKDTQLTIPMDWSAGVTRSVTLYASWTEESHIVYNTVSFDVDGGSVTLPDQTVENGLSITLPSYNGEKDGYLFVGWYYAGITYSAGESFAIIEDTIFTAVWGVDEPIQYYTVYFDASDFSIENPESQTVASGEHIVDPNVTITGYDLVWLLNGEVYDFSTPVTGDIILILSGTEHIEPEHNFLSDNLVIIIVICIILIIIGIVALIAKNG